MKVAQFSIRNRLKSFDFAFNGLKLLLKNEHNARVHFLATIMVCLLGWFFNVNLYEWISLSIVMAMVWMAEIFNTALEEICNFISEEKNPKIKIIKDLAAGGVLVSAVCALIVGLIIFVPKIIDFIFVPK
jgi:diacylglycerol kinase